MISTLLYVVLTEDGSRTLRAAWPVYARGIEAHFTSLISDDEARTLASILERVSAAARHDPPGR